jgi:predicted metalloprotease with PDZ domain
MLAEKFSKMIKKAVLFFSLCLFLSMTGAKEGASKNEVCLEYTVKISKEEPYHMHIKAQVSPVPTGHLSLAMTQNYGHVNKLKEIIPEITVVKADQKPLITKKINEFLWEVDSGEQNIIVIEYAVNTQFPYSSLNCVRLPYRDADHIYFPAASVFIHPDEKYLAENNISIQRIRVNFDLPKGWIAATSWGTNRVSYDLSPSSIENLNSGLVGVGGYRVDSFKIRELPVEVALLNSGPVTDKEINRTVEQALLAGYNLFGFFPVSKLFFLFQFIFDNPGQGNGNGMGWSFNLNYSRKQDSSDWLKESAHIFHEIFHLWNGTEAQPISRAQNDHSLIWFTEGITRFYQYKNMLRSGVISEERYFQFLSEEFGRVYHCSRREDSLDQISEDYYSDRKAMTLTYSKGCCLAFALDSLLQHISSGQKSFDSLMKKMLEKYDFRLNRHCYTHQELDGVFREVLEERFYPSYERLYGKDFVQEFESILNAVGFQVEKYKDKRLYFGIIDFGPPSGPLRAFEIDRESPAYRAGLREQDILLEIDGRPLYDIPDIKKALNGAREGESVNLVIERNGQKMKIQVPGVSFETRFEIKRKAGKDIK